MILTTRRVFIATTAIALSCAASWGQDRTTPKSDSQPVAENRGPQTTTPGQFREQAYAKLLEGQRYLLGTRRSNAEANVRRAREAFQEAAKLDPTLAEARTALAEIAFMYPPYDFDVAIREATASIAIDKNNFGGHRVLSRVYSIKSGLRENNLDNQYVGKAIAELKEVVRLESSDPEAWALLGELYFATGRTNEAVEAWTKWAAAPPAVETRFFQAITSGRELSPSSAAARLGEGLLKAGRAVDATAAIRRAILLDPDNEEYLELLSEAIAAGGAGDDGAIVELERLVAANPTRVAAVRALAKALVRNSRVDDAIGVLRNAVSSASRDEDKLMLRADLAEIYSDSMRYTEANSVYEDLLKDRGIGDQLLTDPGDKEFASIVLRRIFDLQKSSGKDVEALNTIARMRRVLGPDSPFADALYIDLLRDQGKLTEALDATRAARQKFPGYPEFARLEAQALADLGRVDEAIEVSRKRLSGSSDDFYVYLSISSLYTQANRGPEAVSAAKKALEMAPANDQERLNAALLTLATAQERAGDGKGSEASLRRVLDKDPHNSIALNNLGYFLVERNERLEEALEMIKRAVRAEPTNSSYLDSLGWAYFKLGRLDDAERYLKEAAERDRTSATIQEHLGDLYERRGKLDLARIAWKRAMTLSTDPTDQTRLRSKLRDSDLK